MNYYDQYQFNLVINKTKFDIDPTNYSFSVRDSIHDFFSQITFEFNDVTGIFQESLLSSEGLVLNLQYGIKNQSNLSCNYSFINDELFSTLTNDSIGGKLTIPGLHEYYNYQEVVSSGYKDRISNIVQNITSNYNFSGKNINDTGADNIWYRPLMNQKDFIEEILLPNSYSNNSANSPFFCFIDSNNTLNLKNYYSMITSTIQKEYNLLNFAEQPNTNDNQGIGDKVIANLQRFKTGSLQTKKYRNRKLVYRDRNTGQIVEDLDHIYSYPNGYSNYNLPIVSTSLLTDTYDLFYKETDTSLQEAFNGRKINSTKDTFFLERFILTIPLDTNLTAGKMIRLSLPLKVSTQKTDASLNYTDNYLIESSDHIWNGDKRFGYSQLIVSRKFSKLSNNLLIKSQLMAGV